MTRHPTARRVHRQETAPDDAFVAGVLETTAWARKHQRILIISGIAAAVILTALVLWLNNRANTRERAASEISQVRSVALSGNTPQAIGELQTFISRFGGTAPADEARLLLAGLYMQTGQYQQAVDAVQRLSRDVGSDMGVNAALLAASAHEAMGNPQLAEETYLRVGSGGRFLFQRQEALDQAARIRLQAGNVAGAMEIYERIISITPLDSPDRGVFEMRLGEAQARAASPSGAQPGGVPAAPATGAAPTLPGPGQTGTEGVTQPEPPPPGN
jgi:tetratricopeptide (TPR) repeat protein